MQHVDRDPTFPPLTVRCQTVRGGGFDGRVVETTGEIAAADFPQGACPFLAIAQRIRLSFSGGGVSGLLETDARVVYRSDEEDRRRYRFQVGAGVVQALNGLSNGRGEFRVTAGSVAGVEVALRPADGGPGVRALLRDLAPSGLSVFLRPEDEGSLLEVSRVNLSFRLAEDEDPLELVGVIRYRRLTGSSIHCGIELDPAATAGFPGLQRRLSAYVMERQAEMLRRWKRQVAVLEAAGRGDRGSGQEVA